MDDGIFACVLLVCIYICIYLSSYLTAIYIYIFISEGHTVALALAFEV